MDPDDAKSVATDVMALVGDNKDYMFAASIRMILSLKKTANKSDAIDLQNMADLLYDIWSEE